ncbi:MAG: type I-E CRISPR-associated protein Cas5/CasD, partial [Anaerolineae bacterium]|nr:type I-E CRISPR-associated protein Cas5/CasD [Anaerolineae bacterium]
MVHTLLMRISSAWQSWGMQSNFAVRDSGREPTKSGIVGLLCAALGRDRAEPLDDLRALRMGVRVDQAGVLYRDFHTAQDVYRASGSIKPTEPSSRYYLADARFLVGLESQDLAFLQELHKALASPCW